MPQVSSTAHYKKTLAEVKEFCAANNLESLYEAIAPTPVCSQCREYSEGVCQLRAAADWGQASFVKPDRPVCAFCQLCPS